MRAADPELEHDDVVTTAAIIAVAVHETTSDVVGVAMVRLLTHGSIRPVDTIETVDDPLVTELLRMDTPVQAVGRTARAKIHR